MRTLSLLFALFAAIPVLQASAESPGAVTDHFFVVNMQRVIDESIMGRAARSNIQGELKKKEGELSAKRSDIEKQKAELQKQASVLSSAALTERQDRIEKDERKFQDEFNAQREEMTRKTNAEMKKVLDQIDLIMADIGKAHPGAIVMEQDPRLVVYADPRLDMTDEVVKRLNEKKLSL